MEALLSASEDVLIPPLNLGLEKGASYITNRRQATFFSSVPSASYTGVQTVKFNVASMTEFADPESLIISFDVVNDAAQPLTFSTVGAHCLFDRYQCRISATEVENIDHYGRTCESFSRLIPTEKRMNEGALGFGTRLDMTAAAPALDGNAAAAAAHPVTPNLFQAKGHKARSIAGNQRKRVYMKLPLSGVWTANQKYIPLWALGAGGCEILLSLQRPELAAIHTLDGAAQSQAYHLEDIRCEVDLISIDSELMERYSRNLQEGGSLMIHTKLWNVTQVFVAGNSGDFEVTLSKAMSRLATMFVNFSQELTQDEQRAGEMYTNTFKCYPQAYETLESFATIGSKRYPEFPVKGVTSHFWKLTQALGIAKSIAHSVNTDVDSYADDSFVLGIDFEKCPMVASSGVNTQGGSEIRLSLKNFTNGAADAARRAPARAWVCLHSEAIVELRATGAHLLD